MFMKKYLIFCLFFCFACASNGKLVTMDDYCSVQVGTTEKELKQELGEPYAIKCYCGVKEYEYIERIIVPDRDVETRHYFFIIKKDVIISKRVIKEDAFTPLLERNAYDLQTSYNNEETQEK